MGTALISITARDIMHDGCRCIDETCSILEVAKIMEAEGIGALPVCSDDKLVGMITDRDLVVKCLAGRLDLSTSVGDVCNRPLHWVHADAPINDVLSVMEEHQVRRVPVIDENKRVCGMIAQRDIALRLSHEQSGELLDFVSRGPAVQHAT
jgi:CBS domain-containing protein